MTDNTPEPIPADALTEERVGGDLHLEAVYQPNGYYAPKEGHGRWCNLYQDAGDTLVGILWQGDNNSLGFHGIGVPGIIRTPMLYAAWQVPARDGVPSRQVFDAYAEKASLGLSAGPVTEGDLDDLALDTPLP